MIYGSVSSKHFIEGTGRMKMDLFGLSPNTDYKNCSVRVRHKNGVWFDLIRTTAKMAICDNGNDKEKRVHFNSIIEVFGDTSRAKTTSKTEKKPEQEVKKRQRKSGKPLSKDTDAEGFMTEEKMQSLYDEIYGGGTDNPFFGDDFGMASNPEMVVGPDGEMGSNLDNDEIYRW